MATFDQRGQHVTYQYNAAGNINFGAVERTDEIAAELKKLLEEVNKSIGVGALDADLGIDVEAKLKKTIAHVEKEAKPKKAVVLENIEGAIKLVEGVKSAAGLVSLLVEASEMVRRVLL